MPLTDATPTIVAARMIRRLGETLVYAARSNPEYTAEARDGNKVHIVAQGDVTVRSYTPGTAVMTDRGAPGAKIELELSKHQYYSVYIDDVDAKQSRPNILQSKINIGAQKLAEKIDADVQAEMHSGADAGAHTLEIGGSSAKIALNDSTTGGISVVQAGLVKNGWVAAQREMDAANVPQEGRFAIIGPVMRSILNLLYSGGQVSDSLLDSTARNGFAGSLFGFNCYLSSSPKKAADQEYVLWGSDYGVATIIQIDESEQLRDPARFGDIIRGLVTYGTKTIEADSIYEGLLHYDGETVFS